MLVGKGFNHWSYCNLSRDSCQQIYPNYLTDQLGVRGYSIDMGAETWRNVMAVINHTLTDEPGGRYEPLTRDIGIRIAVDPIILDVVDHVTEEKKLK